MARPSKSHAGSASSNEASKTSMLTIISDIHGKFDEYYSIASKSEFSLQLGDFGMANTWNKLHYSGLSPDKHKVLAGNHSAYDVAPNSPHYLGDYGLTTLGDVTVFFIRGGLSLNRVNLEIDRLRGMERAYWPQEELSFAEMLGCMELYKFAKPDIVISHVAPARFIQELHSDDSVLEYFGFPKGFREATALLGDTLIDIHTPKLWISGHNHLSLISNSVTGMQFVSLAELESYSIN